MLFGLTKRQLVCFGSAALVGVPLFFLSKGSMGTTSAALCMILVMLPFFLFALYEKNGQTLEVILGHLIQCKFVRPKRRIYVTNADPGSGLLFFQNVILPFRDEFPKDTELYKLLTTKPSEVVHDGQTG